MRIESLHAGFCHHLMIFFSKLRFSKYISSIRVSNSLHPNQDQHSVKLDIFRTKNSGWEGGGEWGDQG